MASTTRSQELVLQPVPAPDHRRWWALPVMLAGCFLTMLDAFIVNVALPTIQSNLHASFAQVQLVIACYSLAYAVGLITGGRLGDLYGRKRLFLIGMAGFISASAFCGLATTPAMLILARVLQGLMAALMYPQVFSLIQVTFADRERGTALAILGAVLGLASIVGQLVGGVLIQGNLFHLSWRPIFLVNLPFGLAALLLAFPLLRESRSQTAQRLDLGGVALVTPGLLLFIYPLIVGRDQGWPLWTFICLLAALPVLVLFILYERRRSTAVGSPLIVLSLFRNRAFVIGLLLVLVFYAGTQAFYLVLALTLQTGLGLSPLSAGLIFTPLAVGFFGASLLTPHGVKRWGRLPLLLGTVIMGLGYGAVPLTFVLRAGLLQGTDLIPALVVQGIGLGLVATPLLNIVLAEVPRNDAGAASGVLGTIQQTAGALGIALIGIIFFSLLPSTAVASREAALPAFSQQLRAARVAAPDSARLVSAVRSCLEAQETNPTQVSPASPCLNTVSSPGTTIQPGALHQIMTRLLTQVRARMYLAALVNTMWYNEVISLLTGVLLVLLPSRSGKQSSKRAT